MPLGPVIVTAIRLIVPLSIFRYPLGGTLAAAVFDAFDVVLIFFMGAGDFANYHSADKYLDMYFMTFAVLVSLRWGNKLARNVSVGLFLYRLVGFVLFELTGTRVLLLVFPNLFLNFFVAYLILKRYFPRFEPRSWLAIAVLLAILLVPKMGQEYLLHYRQAQPWEWMKHNILQVSNPDLKEALHFSIDKRL